MKKIISLILVLMMALPCFTALADAPADGYDGGEVTITFYHTMNDKYSPILQKAIEAFNVLYPNIHVVATNEGGYNDVRDTIITKIPAHEEPNIAYCYPDHVAMYNVSDAVQTLDDLISSQAVVTRADGTTEIMGLTEEQKADFVEAYYNEGMQYGDGLMYTMPFSKSTEVLYYDKTFFAENNIAVPTTWDELEAVCAQIKALKPNCIPLGYDSESNWFITMTEQYGSPYTSATEPHYLFDNDTNKAFIKKFNEWYQKGYITTYNLAGKKYSSALFTSKDDTRAYMSIGSSAGAAYQRPAKDENGNYPFEVGIATIPQVDVNNRKVISQGPSVVIFKKSNAQEVAASWLLVKYLTTDVDFQADFAAAQGYVPVINSAVNQPEYAAKLASADGGDNITFLSAQVCLNQKDAYYTSPAFVGSSTARDQVAALLIKCLGLTGDNIDAEIARAFQDAIDECEYAN